MLCKGGAGGSLARERGACRHAHPVLLLELSPAVVRRLLCDDTPVLSYWDALVDDLALETRSRTKAFMRSSALVCERNESLNSP